MPLYYTEGDEKVFEHITQVIERIQNIRKVQISMHTRVLIFNVITAIKEDPSPSWTADKNEIERQYFRIVEDLPKIIEKFIEQERLKNKVSIFQALHWLAANIDWICPFQKK